jgi:hypothetical protein
MTAAILFSPCCKIVRAMAKEKVTIELTEADVRQAIADYIDHLSERKIIKMIIRTGVRGDYDKGNAEEYVKEVICECV